MDTVISAINAPHLSWGVKDGKKVPNYTERLNSLCKEEYKRLIDREDINKIDPKAFLFCTHASEVRGEGFTYDFEDTKDN